MAATMVQKVLERRCRAGSVATLDGTSIDASMTGSPAVARGSEGAAIVVTDRGSAEAGKLLPHLWQTVALRSLIASH
jgi:hypothetical protein